MPKYQIEATVEKFELDEKGNLKINLKGSGKYCFEKEKDKKYINIFENTDDLGKSILQDNQIPVKLSETGMKVQHLLDYAFIERKKLKFELDNNFCITGISHAPN